MPPRASLSPPALKLHLVAAVLALLIVFFPGHSVVMVVVPMLLPRAPELARGAVEAVLLTGLAAAVLLWFVVRPLRAASQRRKQAELALEAAERQFRILAEESLAGIYIIQDDRIRYVNPRLAEMLGYPREEIAARFGVRDLIAEEDRELVASKIRERTEGGARSTHYRLHARRKDGTLLHIEVLGARTELDGRPAIVGTALDITERVHTEEVLRSMVAGTASATGDEFFRSLVRHLASALTVRYAFVGELLPEQPERIRTIAVWNGDGFGDQIEYPLAGTPCENVVGKTMACYPDGAQARFPGDHLLAELRVESYLGAPLRATTGQPLGLLVVMDDRPLHREELARSVLSVFAARAGAEMERARAEAALRRSEASLRGMVENAVFGIYRSTVDGRLSMVNQALVAMLGYGSAEELLAVDMATDLYRDSEQRARLVAQYGSRDRFDGIEAEWKRKDGAPVAVRLSGRPLRSELGKVLGFEVIVEDVRERHALEQQLRQAQKMEAVGQLAGGMAHDFNNLLTTILATSEIVGAELPADSPLRGDLQAIREAAQRGGALTGKLLAFSRRTPLEFQSLNLGELIGEFTRVVRRLVPENIEIKMVLEPTGTTVRADPGAIEQIVMNLVTNARDAMPSGGSLFITTERAALDAEFCSSQGWGSPGEYVVLAVSDTGVGMDAETQRRIFEPFFTTKPVGAGTGLGMAMVYGLVKQHGGYVHVTSERARGTIVKVYFPLAAISPGPRVSRELPAVRGGGETILLVEDEPSLRRAAERALRKYGYQVLVAADGREALNLLASGQGHVDLIVTDVVMPRLGGPELIEELRSRGTPTRVVYTSGYTAQDPQVFQELGPGQRFLAKPWTVADLLQTVRATLDEGVPHRTRGPRRRRD